VAVTIYKIFRRAEWENARKTGVFEGSPDDRRDGFIHFSTGTQLDTTLTRHFLGEDNLVLAAVDSSDVAADLKWEESRKGERFPHLYAALPLELVRAAMELRRGADGRFALPPDIAK
jgi:uncharacterized protein (DUF952 family)